MKAPKYGIFLTSTKYKELPISIIAQCCHLGSVLAVDTSVAVMVAASSASVSYETGVSYRDLQA